MDKAVLLGLAPAGGAGGDGEYGDIGDGSTYASAASNRERRRLSIKAAKVRRRKQEVEIAAMEAEDERSKLENRAHRVSWICRSLVVDVVVLKLLVLCESSSEELLHGLMDSLPADAS